MTALIDFLKNGDRVIYPVALTEGIYDSKTGEDLASMLKRMTTNLSGAQSGLLYTTSAPSTVAIGGIPKGWSCNANSVTDVFDKMLHPYIAPKVKATSTPANLGYHEYGASIEVQEFMVDVTKGSYDIDKIEIIREGQLLGTLDSNVMDGGTFSVAIDDIEHPTDDTIYQVKVTDSENLSCIYLMPFKFVYPIYHGTTASVTDANILLMSKTIEDSTLDKTYTIKTENDKFVFAYPSAYGDLEKVVDSNGFNVLNAFEVTEMSISCIDGTTQQYKVYSTYTNSTIDNYKLTFIFQEV